MRERRNTEAPQALQGHCSSVAPECLGHPTF